MMTKKLYIGAFLLLLLAVAHAAFLGGLPKVTTLHGDTNYFAVVMGGATNHAVRNINASNVLDLFKTLPNFPMNTSNYVDGSVTSAKIEAGMTRDTEWDSLAEINAATTDADAVTDARTLTVAGTASEITSSAGAQDLTANRTWTLSLPAAIDLGGKTSFEIPNGAAPVTDAAGEIALDTTITDHTPLLQYYSGATEMLAIAIPRSTLTATDAQVIKYNATSDRFEMGAVAGTGDVVGPASSTDNAVARFDGTGGKTLQNSGVTIDDSGNLTASSFIGSGSGAGLMELQDSDGSHHFRMVPTGTTTTNTHLILPANPEDGFWEFALSQGTNLTLSYVKSSGSKNVMRADGPFATNATFLTSLNIPNGAAPVTDAAGEIALDTTITDHTPLLQYYSGATEMLAIAIPRSTLTATDAQVIKYNATSDRFEMATDSTGSGGDSASVNATAVTDSFSISNTPASGTVPSLTWAITPQTDPTPDLIQGTVGPASASEAGIVTVGTQTFGGNKDWNGTATFGGTVNIQGALGVANDISGEGLTATNGAVLQSTLQVDGAASHAGHSSVSTVQVTNYVKYLFGADLAPTSDLTNYTADFNFTARQKAMTNHVHVSAVSNLAISTNGLVPWTLVIRNFSGSTFTASLDTTIPRNGTNWVAVANAKKAVISLMADGSGGSNITNTVGSIVLYDSP